MTRARVVHRQPARRLHPGVQDCRVLFLEGVELLVEKPHHLAFGDVHPKVHQQGRQPLHGRLPLMVLGQNKTTQRWPEVARNTRRQRRNDGPPIRRQPTLAAVQNRVRAYHQILDHEILVALEA